MKRKTKLQRKLLALLLLLLSFSNITNTFLLSANAANVTPVWKLFKYEFISDNGGHVVDVSSLVKSEVLNNGEKFITSEITEPASYFIELTVSDKEGHSKTVQSRDIQVFLNKNQKARITGELNKAVINTSLDIEDIKTLARSTDTKDRNFNMISKTSDTENKIQKIPNLNNSKNVIIPHLQKQVTGSGVTQIPLPIDAKISDDKKTFFSGNIYQPGSYFAALTVKDKTGQTDTTYTESVTLTQPHQRVIVFATTDPSDKKIFDPTQVEVSLMPGVPVQFKSNVTVLGGRPALGYRWDFADGACIGDDISKLPVDCTSPNPKHYYFDEKKSFMGLPFTDRKSVTPKVTVSARFPDGKAENWEAITGTITFNADPHFVLLNITPDSINGIVPFTVNLMIDSATAKTVDATVTSYDIDYGDGTIESNNITYQELTNKTFTHTYTKPDTYNPRLTVHVKETGRPFVFNIASITASGSGVAGEDIASFSDSFTLEKEQGDLISIENEVLMGTVNKSFRWQTIDKNNQISGDDNYNILAANNIFINYETLPDTYKLKLSQDLLNGSKLEKNYTVNVKDTTAPVIEDLDLTSGNIVAAGDEFSFSITAQDNSALMSLNWTLLSKKDNTTVFNGHEDLSGTEQTKNISFTVPGNISPGDYELVVEVVDNGQNTISSKEEINTDVKILGSENSENAPVIETTTRDLLLEAGISIFGLGASETSSILPTILSLIGLNGLANFIKGLISGVSFSDELKSQIKDLGTGYTKEVNQYLCGQTNKALNKINGLGNLTSEENILKASESLLLGAGRAKKLLKNFNGHMSPGQRLDTLNSQASNVTVVNNSGTLELKSGGDRTNEFKKDGKDAFYLPHLIDTIKKGLNTVASTRAHAGLSILLNSRDLNNIFNVTPNALLTSTDEAIKLLTKGYLTLERSHDLPIELIKAFLSGDLVSKNINKLNDFDNNHQNEKKIVTSYVQRLLQDIGISGPTDGLFTQGQLNTLSSLSPGASSDVIPSDLKYLKDLASKSRSTFLGVRTKNILVTGNREDGYNTFIGSLIGKLASGSTDNSITLKNIVEKYKTNNTEALNYVLSKPVDNATLTNISKELPRKTISLISYLLSGERRTLVISELIAVVQILGNYATQSGNVTAKNNFNNLVILLKTYDKIQDGNEDNIGLLINLKIAKENVLKDELKKKDTKINNSELTSVMTGVPLSLVLKIAGKDKLTEDQKIEVIRSAASIINYAYRDGLTNGIKTNEYNGSFQRLEDVGKRSTLVNNLLREILNGVELNKSIKALQHLEKELREKFTKARVNQDQIIFPLPAESLSDITTNKKETEVVNYLRNEINTRLQPTATSRTGATQDLIVLIDKDISNTTVETKQVKEIIANVFNNIYKDNVFNVNGQQAKVNTTNPDWLFEAPKDPTNEITTTVLYKKDESEIPRKNILLEVANVTLLDKAAIIEQDLIPTSGFDDPLTLFGSVSKCAKSTGSGSAGNPINETPSEYSVNNNSFTFTLDSLGNPTSITLMTSVSITNGAPNGVTGSYNLFDPVSGMIVHVEPFNLPDPIPFAKYVDLPAKTLTGSTLQAILNKLGTQTLSGLLVLVKIVKPGVPVFTISAEFLDPLPAGETIPDTFKRPQILPYINCSPTIQTISSGESAIINYTAGPEKSIQNVSVSSSSKNLDGKKGVISLKPTNDTTVTFTANSESGPSSTQCIVNVIDKNKKPGQIEVTVDDKFINGYDVNEYKNYWHYPVEYKVDGKLIGEVDYFNNMSTVPVTVTPDQNHTVTLTVNGKDVEDTTKLVPSAPPPTSFSFTGGIWRHYRGAETIPLILSSMALNTSEPADLGQGTYFSDLAEVPDCIGGDKTYAIARLLRLFNPDPSLRALNGKAIDLNNPEPGKEIEVLGLPPSSNKFYKETSASYIDLLFNSSTLTNLIQGNLIQPTLRRQYVYSSNNDFLFLDKQNNIFYIDSYINKKDCRLK